MIQIGILGYAHITQDTKFTVQPIYTRYLNNNDFKFHFNTDINLNSDLGYYGSFLVRKEGFDYTKINVYESPNLEMKVLFGWVFLKGQKYSPYFDISYIPTKTFKYDDKNIPVDKDRGMPINLGIKIDLNEHKLDLRASYMNILIGIPVAFTVSANHKYEINKFKSENFGYFRNWFGETVFEGFDKGYEKPFIYAYHVRNRWAIEGLLESKNTFSLNNLDLQFGTELHGRTQHIDNKDGNLTTTNHMFEIEANGKLSYKYYNMSLKTGISDTILIFFNKNGLDKYTTSDQQSKFFYDFPIDYPQDAKPIFNRFTFNTVLDYKYTMPNNIGYIRPYFDFNYDLLTVSDKSRQYITINDHQIDTKYGVEVRYEEIKNLYFRADTFVLVGAKGRNRLNLNLGINAKFEGDIRW